LFITATSKTALFGVYPTSGIAAPDPGIFTCVKTGWSITALNDADIRGSLWITTELRIWNANTRQ
jgi:hypothetical protein